MVGEGFVRLWDLHINNLGLPMYDVPNAVEEFRIMH